MSRRWIRAVAAIAIAVLSLGLTGCLDLLSPDCDDCPGDAHWEYRGVGWIAPVYDTYCVSGDRLLDDCCCGDKALDKEAVSGASWRPLKVRGVEVESESAD